MGGEEDLDAEVVDVGFDADGTGGETRCRGVIEGAGAWGSSFWFCGERVIIATLERIAKKSGKEAEVV